MCSKIFFMYCLFWGKRHVSLLLKAQKAKDYLCSVSFQNYEKGSMMQKGLLKFACYPDCFVLANRFNRLLLHHVCHCKHSPHAMPAPSKECCVCHSPSRLVYQPLQQDPRDLADPECKRNKNTSIVKAEALHSWGAIDKIEQSTQLLTWKPGGPAGPVSPFPPWLPWME